LRVPASVRYTDVKTTENVDACRYQRISLTLIGEVRSDSDASDLIGQIMGQITTRVVVDGNVGTLGGKLPNDG
jgi:hypothetical protein